MRIAIIAITTNNSMSVKAERRRRIETSLADLGMKVENGTAAVRRAPTRVVRRNLRGKSKHLILELPRTTCQAELNRSFTLLPRVVVRATSWPTSCTGRAERVICHFNPPFCGAVQTAPRSLTLTPHSE